MEEKEISEITPLNLILNIEVLKSIKEERININQLFILFALYNDSIDLLNIYDEESLNEEVLIFDYQDLIIHGFLKVGEEYLYALTEKGELLVEYLYTLMDVHSSEDNQEKSIRKLCQEYLNLFPKIKLPSGKYARVSILEIEKKMKVWLKINKPLFKKEYNHKLENSDILKATKEYIDRYSKQGYKFMVTSSYFIQKNEKSPLSDEILAIIQGLDKDNNSLSQSNIIAF